MKFILVGTDPVASRFVKAAFANSWHCLALVDVPSEGDEPRLSSLPVITELEDIAKFKDADLLVLSGGVAGRGDRLKALLRLQSIDMAIVTPIGDVPDPYYELTLLCGESHIRVMPLRYELAHPGIGRISELLKELPIGAPKWIEWTLPLVRRDGMLGLSFLDGWDWVRRIAGEIQSVTATASDEDLDQAQQVSVSARSQSGIVASLRWLTGVAESQFVVHAENGNLTARLPEGFDGPVILGWSVEGQKYEETLEVEPAPQRWIRAWESATEQSSQQWWVDATRQVELADAVARSLKRERAISLEYDIVSEEASFKSVMTAAGCGLIWLVLLIVILRAVGVPWIEYLILPALILFLLAQGLGVLVRPRPVAVTPASDEEAR